MRFRYIDSKGREIALDSVEALAARIELGAVAADTELFDATTETWGPAESHEVVKKLLAEAAARNQGGPPGPPVPMARPDAPGVWPPPPESGEAATVDGLTVAHDLNESVAAALAASGPPVEGATVPSPTEGSTDPEHDLNIGSGLEVEGLETNSVNGAALDREPPMDGFRAKVMDPWELESAGDPRDDGPRTSGPAAGALRLEIDDEWGRSSADKGGAHPFDGPAPLDEPPAGSGGWPAEAMLEDQRFSRKSPSSPMVEVLSAPAIQWAFLVASVLVMGLFGSVGGEALVWRVLLTLGGVSAVGLVTGLLLWRDPERRTLIPAATFGLIAVISVPLFVVGSRAEAAGPGAVAPIESAPPATPVPGRASPPRANPGELAMEGRALEGVIEGLDSLAVAYDIGNRPPQWLQGIYLAHASQYPEVEDYWHRYAAYVAEVRTRDVEWFEASYHARLREAGIRADVIDDLVERGLHRFRATQSRRDKLYRQMAALAESSLELHALLVAREDDIEYQPFRQKGVSKAPVVEALVTDPQLEDRMWAIIGRVALSLESISELGETSPARLQQAMMDSIRVSLE